MVRRPRRGIAICILLGCLMNFPIAWLCVLWPRDWGELRRETWGAFPAACRDFGINGSSPELRIERRECLGVREVASGELLRLDPCGYSAVRIVYGGWPMHSLAYAHELRCQDGSLTRRSHFGLRPPRRPLPESPSSGWVPLLPMWTAFGANSLLYTAVLWGLLCGTDALRGCLLRRQGRCGHCGYPFGASKRCSECGRWT